jgi:hypothetical protein
LAPACDDCAADEANHLQYTSKELFDKQWPKQDPV